MMAYHNKLVVAVKSNGKILREFKDTVYLKFGSEYSLVLKNLNTVRSLVHVFIDGTDITPNGLVIAAGQELNLERSLTNGNLLEGNTLKFIERSSAVEHHRGIKLEDGIVRVEYQFEQVYHLPAQIWPKKMEWPQPWDQPWAGTYDYTLGTTYSASSVMGMSSGIPLNNPGTDTFDSYNVGSTQSLNDAGITVPGSHSDQKFQTTDAFPLDSQKYSIVLKLLGATPDNKPVRESVTVKAKPRCQTCGHTNKASAQYCNKCGTALEIFA